MSMHTRFVAAGLLGLACLALSSAVLADPAGSQSGVAINEINYNPAGAGALAFEYVEVYNPTATARDLSGWTLRDLNATAQPELLLAFPPISLAPGCFLLVLPQVAVATFGDDFDCSDGSALIVAPGWDTGRTLADSGDAVSLSDQTSTLQDFVYYDEQDFGDVVADDQAVAEGIWKNGAAIGTIPGNIAGRSIALRADGAHPNRIVPIAGAEDLDWVQYTAAQAGTPGTRNFPALTTFFRDGFEIRTDSADLSLALASSDPLPEVGGRITIAVSISNAGPDAARGVQVAAPVRPGYTIVGFATSSGTFDPAFGTWDVGTVPAGDGTARLLLSLDVTVPAIAQQTWVAEVTASRTPDPDSTPGNGNAAEDDRAALGVRAASADLSLALEIPATLNVGSAVVLQVKVTNDGPDAARQVRVRVPLPPGLAFDSSDGGYDPVTGDWSPAVVPTGLNTLRITAIVQPAATTPATIGGEIVLDGTFDPDSVPGNGLPTEDDQATAPIRALSADLSLNLSVNEAFPDVGEQVTFTVLVSNAGADVGTGTSVVMELPNGLTFVSATASQGVYSPALGGVWAMGSVAVGTDVATLTVTATATGALAAGTTVAAFVSAAGVFDPDSSPNGISQGEDDTSRRSVRVRSADLSLSVVPSTTTPEVGQQVTLTITATNAGPDQANIQVGALLPAGLTFVGASTTRGTYTPATGVWSVFVSSGGTSETLVITATATAAATAGIQFVAQVTSSIYFDPDSTPNNNVPGEDDQASVQLRALAADLSLTMTPSAFFAPVGTFVSFSIRLTNAGPDPVSNVQVDARLPPGLLRTNTIFPGGTTYNTSNDVWTIANLPAGASVQLAIDARMQPGGATTYIVQVIASPRFDPDSTPNNSQAGEDDQVQASITRT